MIDSGLPICLNREKIRPMIICHSRKYIFIHIHKTGGTSLEIAASKALRWDDLLLGSTAFGEKVQEYYRKRFGIHKHSTLGDVYKFCNKENELSDYKVLALVRDPIKRAFSLYNYISGIVKSRLPQENTSLSFFNEKINNQDFAEYPFLSWKSTQAYLAVDGDLNNFFQHPKLLLDPGMAPQLDFLSVDGSLPETVTIIKLEELPQRMSIIRQIVGRDLEIPHKNQSKVKAASYASVDASALSFLLQRFDSDFDAFSYSRPSL